MRFLLLAAAAGITGVCLFQLAERYQTSLANARAAEVRQSDRIEAAKNLAEQLDTDISAWAQTQNDADIAPSVADASSPAKKPQPISETETSPVRGVASADAAARAGVRHEAPLHDTVVTPGNFEYLGAFRLPHHSGNGTTFGYGGRVITWRPPQDNELPTDALPGSLYVLGNEQHQMIAEVSIPRPVIPKPEARTTGLLDSLPAARVVTEFRDITHGYMAAATDDLSQPFQLGGLEVDGGDLHWTTFRYYNVEGYDFASHGRSPLSPFVELKEGPWHLGPADSLSPEWHAYKHGGYICRIPAETGKQWFNGAEFLSGLQISTGLQTSSQGPALFAYSLPSEVTEPGASLPATPLIWFPMEAPAPGHHPADHWTGAAWLEVDGKAAVAVVGRKAIGPVHYGEPRPGDCDPYKGYHGDSYECRIAFYSVESLIHAAHGQIAPWEVRPFLQWTEASPGGGLSRYLFPTCSQAPGGMAYDSERNLLYLAQIDAGFTADNEFESLPAVHVFRLSEPAAPLTADRRAPTF